MSNELVNIESVKSRMMILRNQPVLLAQDVARIYEVETRVIAQAVKNNPSKFPEGYVFDLTKDEVESLKSKILTLEVPQGRGHYSKRGYKAFSEKGLYMLATILKRKAA